MTSLFDGWLRLAVIRFGLSPDAFWEMPLRDWLSLLDGRNSRGFKQEDILELLKHFPDEGDQNESDG